MRTIALTVTLLLAFGALASDAAPLSETEGIRLGMSRDEVRSSLATTARLEREERRRHEIWTLNGDPRFASLIIGYTKEWNVRFVTAVAKPKKLGNAAVEVQVLPKSFDQVATKLEFVWRASNLPEVVRDACGWYMSLVGSCAQVVPPSRDT